MLKFIFYALIVSSASSVFAKVDVKIEHQATAYYINSEKKVELKGNKLQLDDELEPIWIFSKGRVPFLLVPMDSNTRDINIESPKYDKQSKQSTQVEVDSQLSEIMIQVLLIQKDLRKGRVQDAKNKLNPLMQGRPHLGFLNFLAASVSTLEGDKKAAIQYLEKGLKSHPDYQDGKNLLNRLKEGS